MGLTDEQKEAARLLRTAIKLKLAERSARRVLTPAWGVTKKHMLSEIMTLAHDTNRLLALLDEAEKD